MTGELLGGRYKLLERVGGGGMAVVFKGLDALLNRHVAVKVLRQQYVHDEEFIQRFRREAQSAASLSHPNVVSIYDVGQQDDTHYIVMEFVEGTTLNTLIKERAPLPVEEAVRIAAQICDALDHAHSNGIIHRDIKPHNILIGRGGRVKVTDFGIARAADASQLTQTGSVVGSVHYFSPEHAKGVPAGAQSDIYSLGIVMYQMLTGKLPFHGESPISVALKHLQENVEEPRKINPMIPQSVENIILKSMRKSQAERYRSAKEMLSDLDTCLAPERRNEPKLSFQAVGDDGDDDEATRVMPAIRRENWDPEDESDDVAASGKPRKRWVKPTFWVTFTLALLAGTWFGVQYVLGLLSPQEVPVPNVVGKPQAVAEQLIKEAGLLPDIVQQQPPDGQTVEEGIVFKQDPPGENYRLVVNSKVTLYVSTGKPLEKMPGFVGKTYEEFLRVDLAKLGLTDKQIVKTEVSNDAAPGTILKQDPLEGTEYDPETVVLKLKVSKGPEKVPMPDLIGKTVDQAKSILKQKGLEKSPFEFDEQPSFTDKGKIWKQLPYNPGDLISPGEKITVIVSSGLPADAAQGTVNIQVFPAKEGQDSEVKIQLTDARHEEWYTWVTEKISVAKVYSVNVTVSKDRAATIQVYVDDKRVSHITKTHQDLTAETGGPKPDQPAGANPGASPAPVASPKPGGSPSASAKPSGGNG